jgi:hypothetical protein
MIERHDWPEELREIHDVSCRSASRWISVTSGGSA